MGGLAARTRTLMIAPLAQLARRVSLHTDTPGDVGVNEVVSAAYRRRPIEWSQPADGVIVSTIEVVFTVPPGNYNHLGYWTDDGLFLGGRHFFPVTFTARGTYTLDAGDIRESVD